MLYLFSLTCFNQSPSRAEVKPSRAEVKPSRALVKSDSPIRVTDLVVV
jgi:hypothetical protein